MMFLTSFWPTSILLLLTVTTFFIYKYVTRKFSYWRKRGVYGPKPIAFIGNALELFLLKKTIGDWLKQFYDLSKEPFIGIFVFDEPLLIIKSPELIKNILIKDFNHFLDRTIAAPEHDVIQANLMFFQKSPAWKTSRSKFTPIFTPGKLKGFVPIIKNVAEEMNRYISNNLGTIEAKELCCKFSTNVVSKCFFGIDALCFESEEDSDFRKFGKTIFDFNFRNGLVQMIYFIRPRWVDYFHLDFFEKPTVDYFSKAFCNTMKIREDNKIRINDMIDVLNDLKDTEGDFEEEKLVAQAIQFYAAGFETTSSTLAFTLYELCMNPSIQNKVRSEIMHNLKEHGGITYEGTHEMKYLDQCISETLRKYPALPFLDRRCNEDYKIPGTGVVIEKGMAVYIPTQALHMDEQIFPEAQKYDPDRFAAENFNTNGIKYLPFGHGPRNCIGMRLGHIVTKIALMSIISKFEVERTANTPNPVEFEPKSILLKAKSGLHMRFKSIVAPPF